jgi:hypothetical protein
MFPKADSDVSLVAANATSHSVFAYLLDVSSPRSALLAQSWVDGLSSLAVDTKELHVEARAKVGAAAEAEPEKPRTVLGGVYELREAWNVGLI